MGLIQLTAFKPGAYSQEFTRGNKQGGVGDGSTQWCTGQNMETLQNTNGVVTKIDLQWLGGHVTMFPSGYAPDFGPYKSTG